MADNTDPAKTRPGSTASNTSSASGSLGAALLSAPKRSNSQTSTHKASGPPHRLSFVENQRHPPPSPRTSRHPSLTQQAIQDLLNHPPTNRHPNPHFSGRDWRDVALGELATEEEVRWAEMDTSVEEATMALLKNNPSSVVLIRDNPSSKTAISTFDYNDLNSYLLVVVGLAKPDDEDVTLYEDISQRAQFQTPIPLRDIQRLCRKEQLVALTADATLDKAMEVFGSGIHRLVVMNESSEIVGVLTQLHLLEFFWNEGVNFPAIDRLWGAYLRDLQIGSLQIIAINADAPLADALTLMHNEGLTSVAVVDNGLNVVGNISAADVKHLTSATSLPLLKNTCMHFVSVILSERGVERGRDSFPVFYVNPYSTLAHTVAKLVATQSHRMWVVESASPSPSAPATPILQPSQSMAGTANAPPLAPSSSSERLAGPGASTVVVTPGGGTTSAPQSPLPGQTMASVPASALPGAHLSGRLTGVVSLTDILNLFARSSGLNPSDPSEQRARRRRSSSSSVRPSLDGARRSFDYRR